MKAFLLKIQFDQTFFILMFVWILEMFTKICELVLVSLLWVFLSADMTLINLENRKTGLYGSNLTAIQLQTLKTKVRMIVQNIDRNRSKQLCKCNYSPSGWCSLGGQWRQSPPSPQLSPRDEVPGVPRTPWPKNQECHTGWGELRGGWATGGNGLWLRQVWCLITRCCNTGIWFLSGQFWLKRGPTAAEVGSKKACLTNKPIRVNSLK